MSIYLHEHVIWLVQSKTICKNPLHLLLKLRYVYVDAEIHRDFEKWDSQDHKNRLKLK